MLVYPVKQALAAAMRTVSGLDAYAYSPDSLVTPCVYIADVEIEPNNTFGGMDVADFTVRVLVSAADDESGQTLLDEFLSRTGSNSIRVALDAARGAPGQPALGGAADDLNVTRVGGYRLYTEGADVYYGAELTVRVWDRTE